ncbi:MAG: PQQ-binding-like beta-propeller repeat protein [candidate division WOR-3 bacterium]
MSQVLFFIFILGEVLVPPPDSFICPLQSDTTNELELVIFPPGDAQFPLSYKIDWGDGETLDWTEPIRQPINISRFHRYRSIGTFTIRVMARDAQGNRSSWSKPCSVEVKPSLIKWFFPTLEAIVAAPALDQHGNIYIGDEGGTFYSLSPQGNLRFSFTTKGPIYAGATIDRGFVYLPSLDSHLYCLDTLGKLHWSVHLGDELWSPVAVSPDGKIYLGTDSGKLIALNQKGKILFTRQLGDEIASAPTIAFGLIYLSADSLYCFTPKGIKRWAFGTPEGSYFFPAPVLDEKGNIYVGNSDGYLYCIGPNGRLRWRAPSPDEDEIRTEVVFASDGALLFGTDGYYLCVKPSLGTVQTLYETNDIICATPAVSKNGTIYSLSDDGIFYAFTSTGRLLFTQEIASENKEIYYTSSPAIAADGTVYVGSWDGGIYAFYGDAPPLETIWPQFRQNAQHTGRIVLKGKR